MDSLEIQQNSSSLSEVKHLFAKTVLYHDVFEFPLTQPELIKWRTGNKMLTGDLSTKIVNFRNGYYFLDGRQHLIYLRLIRKRIASRKFVFARKGIKIMSFIPSIKMVGLTGSLAMENATLTSDIDLLIVTSKGTLWTTRILVYLLLSLFGIKLRKPKDGNEKDKFCMNIWLDETDLKWKKDRNAYTAHEIVAFKSVINRNRTYEKFLWENRWVRDYWPNAVKIYNSRFKTKEKKIRKSYILNLISWLIEPIAFWFQYQYMRSKITREVVTPTRALFHPFNWSKLVLSRI